ncbi:MAG: hypothetical protein Q8M29_08970 [Bacteroidota bacterium]|nr:hypothetical protein [Bacteroidota bacterium]
MKKLFCFAFLALTIQICRAQRVLPERGTFFCQLAYNRPIDYAKPNRIDHGNITARFNSGFSSAIGIQIGNNVAFCPTLRYTYTSGKSYGDQYGHTYNKEYTSDFYLGRLNGELLIKKLIGQRKALSIGIGGMVGSMIYKNINGNYTYSGITPTSNSTYVPVYENYTLPTSFFGTSHIGGVFDIAYVVKNSTKTQSCFSFGSRIAFIRGIMPWVKGHLETEVYATFHFWGKGA